MRSISPTCRATSIDQASSGFPPSGRMFFPITDLLPPLAGMTAMTRFPFSMKRSTSSFNTTTRAQSAKAVERLAVLGPFSRVDPGIFANREDANAPSGILDPFDEFGHIAVGLLRQ